MGVPRAPFFFHLRAPCPVGVWDPSLAPANAHLSVKHCSTRHRCSQGSSARTPFLRPSLSPSLPLQVVPDSLTLSRQSSSSQVQASRPRLTKRAASSCTRGSCGPRPAMFSRKWCMRKCQQSSVLYRVNERSREPGVIEFQQANCYVSILCISQSAMNGLRKRSTYDFPLVGCILVHWV